MSPFVCLFCLPLSLSLSICFSLPVFLIISSYPFLPSSSFHSPIIVFYPHKYSWGGWLWVSVSGSQLVSLFIRSLLQPPFHTSLPSSSTHLPPYRYSGRGRILLWRSGQVPQGCTCARRAWEAFRIYEAVSGCWWKARRPSWAPASRRAAWGTQWASSAAPCPSPARFALPGPTTAERLTLVSDAAVVCWLYDWLAMSRCGCGVCCGVVYSYVSEYLSSSVSVCRLVLYLPHSLLGKKCTM